MMRFLKYLSIILIFVFAIPQAAVSGTYLYDREEIAPTSTQTGPAQASDTSGQPPAGTPYQHPTDPAKKTQKTK